MTGAQQHWQRCRHWIAAAVKRGPGLETIEDVERLIETGRYIFFPGDQCAAVCEVSDYSGHANVEEVSKALTIMYAGGDLDELTKHLEPVMSGYATSIGCKHMLIHGRKGWERAVQFIGYDFACVTLIKNLRP